MREQICVEIVIEKSVELELSTLARRGHACSESKQQSECETTDLFNYRFCN